jgi:hypothetical protein
MANIVEVQGSISLGQGNIATLFEIPKGGTAFQGVGYSDAFWFGGKVSSGQGILEAVGGIARIEVTCASRALIESDDAIWTQWDIPDANSEKRLFTFPGVSAIRMKVDSGTARCQIIGR